MLTQILLWAFYVTPQLRSALLPMRADTLSHVDRASSSCLPLWTASAAVSGFCLTDSTARLFGSGDTQQRGAALALSGSPG